MGEYLQKADGAVEPKKIHTVVISSQHAEPSKAVRSKECAGYSGPEMTAPSMEEMNKLIVDKVIKTTLSEIKLKAGQLSPYTVTSPTCTSTQLASSSLEDHKAMLVSLAVKSSSTHTVAGEHM